MNMLEALALARDEGKKVRPVCWRKRGWTILVHEPDDNGIIVDLECVCTDAEIFGEWEVVE